jgi:hypothetical protein
MAVVASMLLSRWQLPPAPSNVPAREERVKLEDRVAVRSERVSRDNEVQEEVHWVLIEPRDSLDKLRHPDKDY